MTVPARGLEGDRWAVLMRVLGLTVVLHVSLEAQFMVSLVVHLCGKKERRLYSVVMWRRNGWVQMGTQTHKGGGIILNFICDWQSSSL